MANRDTRPQSPIKDEPISTPDEGEALPNENGEGAVKSDDTDRDQGSE